MSPPSSVDQAQGILEYIQAKLPDRNYDVDGLMAAFVNAQTRLDDLPEEVAFTVNAIAQISAKSYPTLFRTMSLL